MPSSPSIRFQTIKKQLIINSKPEELVHREEASSSNVPLLRRFSGGGTVLLGPGCIWATLVGGEEHLPAEVAGRGPRPLMEWTERVWGPVFGRIGEFKLREHGMSFSFFSFPEKPRSRNTPFPHFFRSFSFARRPSHFASHFQTAKKNNNKKKKKKNETDYAFGDFKFGGNAQALSRKRWLHHSSLLWSVDAPRMRKLLKQPSRAPDYREGREHGSFLTSLEAQNELAKEKKEKKEKEGGDGDGDFGGFFESRRHFVESLAPAVASFGGFELVPTTLEEAEGMVEGVEHHRSTVVI